MAEWDQLSQGFKASMSIEGLDALRKRMRQLPLDVQSKVMAGAVAKAAIVIRDDARQRAPVLLQPNKTRTAGLLRRMISSTRGVRRDSEASAFVSVRRLVGKSLARAKGKKGVSIGGLLDPFYWMWVEFGNSRSKAQPFLRPAFDTKKEEAVAVLAEELRKGIDSAANALR